jgi:hypothetical protein
MDRVSIFLIGRKYGQKDRRVNLSFRQLKAQMYWPTTDQKVWDLNPYGAPLRKSLLDTS